MAKVKAIDVNRTENYINRELSWLDFNFNSRWLVWVVCVVREEG